MSCKVIGFKSAPSLFARRVIGTFKAECKYKCVATINYAEKEEHESVCPFRLMDCKLCTEKLTMRDLYEHMKTKHLKNLYSLMIEFCLGEEEIRKMESSKMSKLGKSSNSMGI